MMTIQEMFSKAVVGLRGQGFERALRADGGCAYLTVDGRRCAWGHVDTDLDLHADGSVKTLRNIGEGLAGELDDEGIRFALDLQNAHDSAHNPEMMEGNLREVAIQYGLEWPA